MIDEKKLIAEIERLKTEKYNDTHDEYDGFVRNALDRVVNFINSIPEEPVNEDLEDTTIQICQKVLKGETIVIDGYEYVVLSDAEECFKAGAKWQKEQMLKDTFTFEYKHYHAGILASECLRNHGWFDSERAFNNLLRFLIGDKELFKGNFDVKEKVKLIIIKED